MSGIVGHRGLLLSSAEAGPGDWVTAFNWPADSGPSAGWGGYTFRQVVGKSELLPGSKLRLTLRAGAGQTVAIGVAYVQVQADSGGIEDYASAPFQMYYAGAPSFTFSGTTPVTLDEVSLPIDASKNLVFGFFFSGSTDLQTRGGGAPDAATRARWTSGNDAATVGTTGYATAGSTRMLLAKLEVFQPA